MLVSPFNIVALKACNFIKKRLQPRCFLWNLWNFWEHLIYRTLPVAASVTFLFFTEQFETLQSGMKTFWPKLQTLEAVNRGSSVKQVFFTISQNLQKNTITSNQMNTGFKTLPSAYFHLQPTTLLKKTSAQPFPCEFSEISFITYYVEHSKTGTSAFR